MIKINIKPLSVNEAWKGKRYRSDKYINYQKDLGYLLKPMKLPPPPYKIYFEFGFSSAASDWDNPIKPAQDIICKYLGFDDKHIHEANVKKVKVKKGEEYLMFDIQALRYD